MVLTSTELHGRTGLHATLAHQAGDWEPTYPQLQLARLNPVEPARVYEVNSAEDWHDLTVRYPAPMSTETHRGDAHGMTSGRSPVWSAAAQEWDAVHLTFTGFLTATYVLAGPTTNPTTLWTWDCEQTLWLRDPPGSWTQVAPLTERPNPVFGTTPLRLLAAEPRDSTATAWLRNG